jgi:hypothetical protein
MERRACEVSVARPARRRLNRRQRSPSSQTRLDGFKKRPRLDAHVVGVSTVSDGVSRSRISYPVLFPASNSKLESIPERVPTRLRTWPTPPPRVAETSWNAIRTTSGYHGASMSPLPLVLQHSLHSDLPGGAAAVRPYRLAPPRVTTCAMRTNPSAATAALGARRRVV